MTAAENVALIRACYEALAEGDVRAASAAWANDIIWHEQTGSWPLAGRRDGVAAVIELYAAMADEGLGDMRLDIHDVVANDKHVIGLVVLHATRAGREATNKQIHVWHIEDGRAVEVRLVSTGPAEWESLWAE